MPGANGVQDLQTGIPSMGRFEGIMQTVNTIIFILGVFVAVFAAFYLLYLIRQRLPEHTRVALEQFARFAVFQVEKQQGTLSGPAKKELAIASVIKLFQAFGLPVPPAIAIDIAIEFAVFLMQKMGTSSVESNNPSRIEAQKQSG